MTMIDRLKESVRYRLERLLKFTYPQLSILENNRVVFGSIENSISNSKLGINTWLYSVCKCQDSEIGDYTYISENSKISLSQIGKFCSIGPNFVCGWGIHPLNGISTSPMFYSTRKQNGVSFSKMDKIEERKKIIIGNDVFIGMNVTILDGVTINDGAVIGAGAVVTQDIPPYAIAVGVPAKVVKYRFDDSTIERLMKVQWWNFEWEKLKSVERYFFDVNKFLVECEKANSS